MADTYWGASPEVLTVSASPSPTTTGFTVSNATNLLPTTVDHPGQYILVKVAGVHQRAQIQSILGNAITLTAPLSGVPDTPGEVINSRELIAKDKLNSQAVFHAANAADLKTVNTSRAKDNLKYYIPDVGMYRFSSSSTATGDDYRVITPTTGPGRFLLDLPSNLNPVITQSGHGFVVGNVVRKVGSSWTKSYATAIDTCTASWLVTAVNGNSFTLAKNARVRVAGHGLTVGSTYFLDPAVPGALTTTKPIGTTGTPLGFHLPVLRPEDADTLDIFDLNYPVLDELIAQHIFISDTSGVTFSQLDIDTHGSYRIEMDLHFYSGGQACLLYINGESSGGTNYGVQNIRTANATVTASRNNINTVPFLSTSFGSSGVAGGTIEIRRCSTLGYSFKYSFAGGGDGGPGSEFHQEGSIFRALNANLTSLSFTGGSFTYRAGSKIRIYRGK